MQKPRDPNWGPHKGDSSRVLTPRSTEAQRPQPRLGPGLHGDHVTGHQVPPRTGASGRASREGKGSRLCDHPGAWARRPPGTGAGGRARREGEGSRPWVTRVPGAGTPQDRGRWAGQQRGTRVQAVGHPGARGRRPGPAGRALSAEEPLRQGEAGSRLRCSLRSSDPGSGTVRFHKTSIMKAIRQVQN